MSDGWLCGEMKCRVCSHVQVCVWPHGMDEDNAQCDHCECMTAEVISIVNPDGSVERFDDEPEWV